MISGVEPFPGALRRPAEMAVSNVPGCQRLAILVMQVAHPHHRTVSRGSDSLVRVATRAGPGPGARFIPLVSPPFLFVALLLTSALTSADTDGALPQMKETAHGVGAHLYPSPALALKLRRLSYEFVACSDTAETSPAHMLSICSMEL